ncbi:MAG: helix-turn-helix domain-containing protein [Pseudomonadota bacterium]
MATQESRSYRPKQAAELLGIGTATLWRWIKERPGFPQPIRLSARCTVIPGDQLIAWRDAQATAQQVQKVAA